MHHLSKIEANAHFTARFQSSDSPLPLLSVSVKHSGVRLVRPACVPSSLGFDLPSFFLIPPVCCCSTVRKSDLLGKTAVCCCWETGTMCLCSGQEMVHSSKKTGWELFSGTSWLDLNRCASLWSKICAFLLGNERNCCVQLCWLA